MADYRKLTDTEKMVLCVDPSLDLDMGHALLFGKTLLTIAGADGDLPETEMLAFWQFMSFINLPASVREELENFDFQNADLDELISQVSEHELSREAAKRLALGAIKISMSDNEYHEKEKAAVIQFCEKMGVDQEAVAKLESMAKAGLAVVASNMALLSSI